MSDHQEPIDGSAGHIDDSISFPEDFLWGASTSAHQVEGGMHNQWSEWELKNAEELARTAEERNGWLPNWQAIKPYATDPANYISGAGIDHYNRYKEDFTILESLGLNALRFGIEWSRVQPDEDRWDEDAIRHYHEYIDELNRRGIEPVMTLWHWTEPLWFTEKGAFEKRTNIRYFERYVERMAQEFGHKVRYTLTLNEPNMYAFFGYLAGSWPPQRKNPLKFVQVYRNLTIAHNRAYRVLKAANPELRISFAAQLAYSKPGNPRNPIDRIGVKLSDYLANWWFMNRVRGQLDFVALNFYYTNYVHGIVMKNPKQPVNDLGWYMEPANIRPMARELYRRYKKPILITENGVPDFGDENRSWWIQETMQALSQGLQDGIPLIGYMYWSLLDNFEWNSGWWPKFGLVAVDRENGMRRTVHPSARWFQQYITSVRRKNRASSLTQVEDEAEPAEKQESPEKVLDRKI